MQTYGLRGVLSAVFALLFRGRRGLALSLTGYASKVVETVKSRHGGVGKEAFALDIDTLFVADVGHVCPGITAKLLFAQANGKAVGVVADLVLAEGKK